MTAHGMLVPTPVSLLARLKEEASHDDWARFVDIYGPVIYTWAKRRQLQPHDAADLTQEVLAAVVDSIGRWQQDPARGRFRGWLWTITRNKLFDFWRSERRRTRGASERNIEELLDQLPASDGNVPPDWDETYQGEVLNRALRALRPEFSQRTWQAFEQVALRDLPPKEVATELGLSLNAVYVAKSRVLKRLREELEGLME